MKTATLLRQVTSLQGTFGILTCEDFSCFISELPWKDNRKQLSCIPEGSYQTKWKRSPKFGLCYEVLAVPNRGNILIHAGNFVGSVEDGFKTNSYGCLLPAKKLGSLAGQNCGLLSLPALKSLNAFFNKETFLLEIQNAYPSN